jgi:hypothetical protein
MRPPSVKVNLRWPRLTATSIINTCFCVPPGAPLPALERTPIAARTFRVTQIPIAEPAAPSAHFTRGFVPWRLSDDGRAASRTISIGRHPKPLYGALVVKSDFHSFSSLFHLFFLFQFFCSARAEPFFRPGRSFRGPSRAAAVKDGARLRDPPRQRRAASLTAASTTAGCVGLGRHTSASLVRESGTPVGRSNRRADLV